MTQVADYLDLDFGSSFFISKDNIIDMFLQEICIENKYIESFFIFYKHLRINKIEVHDDLNQLFIETKPLYRTYDLEIDWDDITQALMAPKKLIEYYYNIYEKIYKLKIYIRDVDEEDPNYEKAKNAINKIGLSITLEKHYDKLSDIWTLY